MKLPQNNMSTQKGRMNMKKTLKKMLTLTVACLMIVLLAASCSGRDNDKDVTTGKKTDGTTTVYTTTTDVETTSEVTTTEKFSWVSSSVSSGAPWIISKTASTDD